MPQAIPVTSAARFQMPTSTAWLTSLFKDQSDLAWGAIETANQRARSGRMMGRQPDDRLKALRALKRIGQSLLDGTGESVDSFRVALDMMSMTILEEAEDTKRRRQDERFRFILPEQLGEVLPTAAWLRADGILALTLPNIASFAARLMGSSWFYYVGPDHVHYFTPTTIRRLLDLAGYRDITVRPAYKPMTIDYAADQLQRLTPSLAPLARAALRVTPRPLRHFSWPVPLGEIVVTARPAVA